MEKIELWFSVRNGGDGSAYPIWFLNKTEANKDQDDQDEGWGEPCIGMVESFVGSNIHRRAVENSNYQKENP